VVWARVHKIDRIRPQADGRVIILIEDERNAAGMSLNPPLSTLVAVARILNARRVLAGKFNNKGEVRYATSASPPSFMLEAIARSGAAVSNGKGERVIVPAVATGSIAPYIDDAFVQLAHQAKADIGAPDLAAALRMLEVARKTAPLDRDANPTAYWRAVLELAAVGGELARRRGGRWIDTADSPIPFALRYPDGTLAHPARLAAQIVEGHELEGSIAAPDVAAVRAALDDA
jgi:hypothetical protein